VTTPSQARKTSDDGPRVYAWPPTPPHNLEVISVTSATKLGLPKPYLIGWAAKVAAEFAVDNLDAVKTLVDAKQKRAAVDLIKGEHNRNKGNKADRGTIVHAAVEAYVAGKPMTEADIAGRLEEARVDPSLAKATYGMAQGVLAYLQDTEPEILRSEATVYSRTYEYAGTTDLLARAHVGGSRRPAVLDVKTSKSIYDEVAIQLTAYARADFVGLDDGTEVPLFPDGEVPEYGIAIRPMANGRYETATFALNDDVFRLFLSCLQTARLDGVQSRARRPS
jgi:hypothetical protein